MKTKPDPDPSPAAVIVSTDPFCDCDHISNTVEVQIIGRGALFKPFAKRQTLAVWTCWDCGASWTTDEVMRNRIDATHMETMKALDFTNKKIMAVKGEAS